MEALKILPNNFLMEGCLSCLSNRDLQSTIKILRKSMILSNFQMLMDTIITIKFKKLNLKVKCICPLPNKINTEQVTSINLVRITSLRICTFRFCQKINSKSLFQLKCFLWTPNNTIETTKITSSKLSKICREQTQPAHRD